MKKIAICFGGVSPEHEVSVITALQVIENIDIKMFAPYAIYVSSSGEFFYLPNISDRSDFKHAQRISVSFGKDTKGGYILFKRIIPHKVYLDCAYMAFHGGSGESGQFQGLFESCAIPYTGQNVLTSAVSMNKQVTKEIVSLLGVETIPGLSIFSDEIKENLKLTVKKVLNKIKLPVIVKPAHLGSSIGVIVCNSEVSLAKALLSSMHIDSEIVIEKQMKDFVEYNCAVRTVEGIIEVSEIEKPIKKDSILSFADKYQSGAKKTGGMSSLARELPASMTLSLKSKINDAAIKTYKAIRATGMLRCDFMYVENRLYLIEVNPIPGSMSYYLWEASGVNFTDQITSSIKEALSVNDKMIENKLDYKTDIIENFIKAN